MPQVEWSSPALEKLANIFIFLDEISEDLSNRLAIELRIKLKTLSQSPKIGRMAIDTDFNLEYREYIIPFGSSGYIVLYEIVQDIIFIHSIRHQKEAGYKID